MPNGAPATHLFGRERESAALLGCLAGARAGQSQVLVLRGDAGVGKSALLTYLVEQSRGFRIARLAGAESEMELAFAGLHQLCAPMLDRLARLPGPQHDALVTAFGLVPGEPPNQFLVGLAVLGLLAEVAEEQPLLCVIDDAHWLDEVSAQSLVFAARRLLAERVAMIFAVRDTGDQLEFAGLRELTVPPLGDADSRALLDSVILGPVDEQVRDRIVAETRGNPLALLELPRGLTPAELAGGFGLLETPLSTVVEQSFLRRLQPLPVETRQLLLAAAADPLGDVTLLWRGVDLLGLDASAADAAVTAGLIELDTRVRFRHPLVRSAVYQAASPEERRIVHHALAEATDESDLDRRAWHRAHTTSRPDETVAEELERGAGRAHARGGCAAAAAFLEYAAELTPDPSRRAQRALAAASAKRDAGALDAALRLLAVVESGPPEPVRTAEVEHLRGQVALDQRRSGDAARLLLGAARQLEPLDAHRARETHLESLGAAIWANGLEGRDFVRDAAQAARAAPAGPDPRRPVDVLLDGFAMRFTAGYTTAAPRLTHALDAVGGLTVGAEDVGRALWFVGNRAAGLIPLELWDFDSWEDLANRQIQLARSSGALVQLQFALNFLAGARLVAGDLMSAGLLLDEDRSIADSTGSPAVAYCSVQLAALRGLEAEAKELIATTSREATAHGQGRIVVFADYATAVLGNGLGHYDDAQQAARRAFGRDVLGLGNLVVSELAEAASRTGDAATVASAVEWVSERARATPTAWARGIASRVRALVSEGDVADALYRESVEHLGRTRLRLDLARTRLLYGEWLRREGRRVDAREQLHEAHDTLTRMRADGFAERARRELLATGETVRKRTDDTRAELTAQESQVAALARDGHTNPEIGAELFISARTVEWHLRKVFTKLGITSRRELRSALVGA